MSRFVPAAAVAVCVLLAGCGPFGSDDDAATVATPSASSTASGATSPTPPPPAKTPTQPPKPAGKLTTVKGMSFNAPKTWFPVTQLTIPGDFVPFSDRGALCTTKVHQDECPLIYFINLKAKNANNYLPGAAPEKRFALDKCFVMGASKVLPPYQPLKRLGTFNVGGHQAKYYEQVFCPPSVLSSKSKMYVWYIEDKDVLVVGQNVSRYGLLDVALLRAVLANASWK